MKKWFMCLGVGWGLILSAPAQLIPLDGDTVPVIPNEACQPILIETIIQNGGNEAVEITQVEPSCGCSAAEILPKTLEPGESGILTVSVNPLYAKSSELSESVTLIPSVGEPLMVNLIGEVPPCIELSVEELNLGEIVIDEIDSNVSKTRTVTLEAPDSIFTMEATTEDEGLAVQVIDSPEGNADERMLEVIWKKSKLLGSNRSTVKLLVNEMEHEEVPVVWNATSKVLPFLELPLRLDRGKLGEKTVRQIQVPLAPGYELIEWSIAAEGEEAETELSLTPSRTDDAKPNSFDLSVLKKDKGQLKAVISLNIRPADQPDADPIMYEVPLRMLVF